MGFCFQKCLFAGRLTIAYFLAACVTAWYHLRVIQHSTAYMLLSREVASLPSVSVIIMPRVCFSDNKVIECAPPFNYLETQTLLITELTGFFFFNVIGCGRTQALNVTRRQMSQSVSSQYWIMTKINRMNQRERAVLATLDLCVVVLRFNLMNRAVSVLSGSASNDFYTSRQIRFALNKGK